jgi:hypothetical protein
MNATIYTNPSDVLSCAMGMSDSGRNLKATFTANPELAVKAANLFMATYPLAKASADTIKALRTALRRVEVADTEAPYTLTWLKESQLFVLGRATPKAHTERNGTVEDAELTPEQQAEVDKAELLRIIDRMGLEAVQSELDAVVAMRLEEAA